MYLLETSLHQVLWEQVPDQIKEGIQAGDLVVLLALAEVFFQFGVSRVDDEHQDDPQDGSNDGGGHVVDHSSGAQTTTGLGIQTSQPCNTNEHTVFTCDWK